LKIVGIIEEIFSLAGRREADVSCFVNNRPPALVFSGTRVPFSCIFTSCSPMKLFLCLSFYPPAPLKGGKIQVSKLHFELYEGGLRKNPIIKLFIYGKSYVKSQNTPPFRGAGGQKPRGERDPRIRKMGRGAKTRRRLKSGYVKKGSGRVFKTQNSFQHLLYSSSRKNNRDSILYLHGYILKKKTTMYTDH